jgi:serine/threonine protein phosphatase 1
MKYFVISDIHSHYEAMISSLENAGYNQHNRDHHLIVLGDLFDRGDNAVKVYKFLHTLTDTNKATMIIGNHDLFLLDFLNKRFEKVYFNMKHNGFDKTLKQFSGLNIIDYDFEEIYQVIMRKYPELRDWLNGFLPFLELGKYIFVHGGIDGAKQNWKKTPLYELVWNREINLQPLKDKIVVAGHHRTATIRNDRKDFKKLYKDHPDKFDILYKEGKILIDRFVEISKSLNVLILDDL